MYPQSARARLTLHTALILVPTRELALQTAQVCKTLGKHLNLNIMTTTGGTSLKDDIIRLHAVVHIVVATPGRLLDLSNKGVCKLHSCRILVMDEVRMVTYISSRLIGYSSCSRHCWDDKLLLV